MHGHIRTSVATISAGDSGERGHIVIPKQMHAQSVYKFSFYKTFSLSGMRSFRGINAFRQDQLPVYVTLTRAERFIILKDQVFI
jgi:hypothetical protein